MSHVTWECLSGFKQKLDKNLSDFGQWRRCSSDHLANFGAKQSTEEKLIKHVGSVLPKSIAQRDYPSLPVSSTFATVLSKTDPLL